MSWQPSASLPALHQRAILYRLIRAFFAERDILELDVPLLSEYATVDPFINSIEATVMSHPHYLQTSPEFYLKRFLAAYPQDVYYLGKAFRDDEKGQRHSPEFTMLEWYRVGWDEQSLIEEVRQLLVLFFPDMPWCLMSYREVFQTYLSLDPHSATSDELRQCAYQYIETSFDSDDKNAWLDLLFTHCIEPKLPNGIVGIYDYPATQAALARVDVDSSGQQVAKRFEIYIDQIELANGYWELADPNEQERRFNQDQEYRALNQLPVLPYDQALVDALKEGQFPDCAGVALGIDRLLMCYLKKASIGEVISFR